MIRKGCLTILVLVIAIFVIIFVIVGLIFINTYLKQNTVCTQNCEKTVGLNEEFKLIRGETARLKNSDFELKIKDFELRPDSSWNGPKVQYEIVTNGKTYGSPPYWYNNDKPPYFVSVIDSDYLSFARFKIEAPEAECREYVKAFPDNSMDRARDDCFVQLATNRFNDEKYCNMVLEIARRDDCYYILAFNRDNVSLCEKQSTSEKIKTCIDNVSKKQN
jgi:hypothetical protein